jgi:hypothetical protein
LEFEERLDSWDVATILNFWSVNWAICPVRAVAPPASTVAVLSMWICGWRADIAEEGLPTAHNSTGSATTINA